MKIMPLVAQTPQLRLRWTELSWSVGAECGNMHSRGLWEDKKLFQHDSQKKNVFLFCLLFIQMFAAAFVFLSAYKCAWKWGKNETADSNSNLKTNKVYVIFQI